MLLMLILKALYTKSHKWNTRSLISKDATLSQRNKLENKAAKLQCIITEPSDCLHQKPHQT